MSALGGKVLWPPPAALPHPQPPLPSPSPCTSRSCPTPGAPPNHGIVLDLANPESGSGRRLGAEELDAAVCWVMFQCGNAEPPRTRCCVLVESLSMEVGLGLIDLQQVGGGKDGT